MQYSDIQFIRKLKHYKLFLFTFSLKSNLRMSLEEYYNQIISYLQFDW